MLSQRLLFQAEEYAVDLSAKPNQRTLPVGKNKQLSRRGTRSPQLVRTSVATSDASGSQATRRRKKRVNRQQRPRPHQEEARSAKKARRHHQRPPASPPQQQQQQKLATAGGRWLCGSLSGVAGAWSLATLVTHFRIVLASTWLRLRNFTKISYFYK